MFKVHVDIGLPAGIPVGAAFPNLEYAVARVAEHGQGLWQQYASGKPLPNGKVIHARSGAYMRSIQLRALGALSQEIFSDLDYANYIEEGTPAYDLKRILHSSLKVRVSEKGKRYLIIPFRWGTPGSVGFSNVMPEGVHEAWQQMRASHIVGVRRRESGTGALSVRDRNPVTVRQRLYRWGDRMDEESLRAAGARGTPLRRMSGMVHMQNRSGKHGQYLTFRVMSEDSTGWMRPAMPGYHPAETVAKELQPIAETAFAEAAKRDFAARLGAG